MVCLSWRSTFLLPRWQEPPKVWCPFPPPGMGGLGGAFAPSIRPRPLPRYLLAPLGQSVLLVIPPNLGGTPSTGS
jgi:hypothetical protein